MQKHTKEGQLNNAGFSLVELLIAMVVLAIIVVPLLHSFVTSARTNAKSRSTMHATAIAEDVMEMFEAHSLEEMAEIYEGETPEGFTNTVNRDVNGDGTGIWKYTVRDDSTTSSTYDVVITMDPTRTEYDMFNDKDIVELENLSGGRNAVYAEAEDSATDAYLYYKTGTDKDIPTIARYTTKTIQINIMTGKISLDLGLGEITEADTYLVTASTVYHCNTGIVDLGGKSGDYPQNGQDYVIFSNENSLREQADRIRAKKADGTYTTEDKIQNGLANIIVCLQPRVECVQSGIPAEPVDRVIVNNPGNVPVNVFLAIQEPSDEWVNSFGSRTYYDTLLMSYKASFELRETYPAWNPADGDKLGGADFRSACRLRTNLITNGNTVYTFRNLSMTGTNNKVDGNTAKSIMDVDSLTPKEKKNRIYDMRVEVYAEGDSSTGRPIVTMTGTAVE